MPVLVILALLWAVVLVPPLLRSRSQHTASSIVDFNYKLDVLGRTKGGPTVVDAGDVAAGVGVVETPLALPMAPLQVATAASRSARRRRNVMRVLTSVVTITLLLGALTQLPAAWGLQIVADVVMVAYLGLWAWLRSARAERLDKVRYLPKPLVPQPRRAELVLRRSASS